METRHTRRDDITIKDEVEKRNVCFSQGEQHLPAEIHGSAGAKAGFALRAAPLGRWECVAT